MAASRSETGIGTNATRAKVCRRRSFGLEYPYRVVGRIRRGVRREWVDPRFRESSRQRAEALAPGPLDAA